MATTGKCEITLKGADRFVASLEGLTRALNRWSISYLILKASTPGHKLTKEERKFYHQYYTTL